MNSGLYRSYGNSGMGFAAGIGAGYLVIMLALIIFEIVCMWRVFEKAGEGGWKSLIPIYNVYVFYKIAWEVRYFVFAILGMFAAVILAALGASANSGALAGIGSFLLTVLYFALAVMSIIAMVKMARRFGKGGGFAVGLVLLSFIFIAILAFDDSVYDRSLA